MADKVKRPGPGRPPVAAEEKRKHVKIALSDVERAELDAHADAAGVSRSEFVRRAVASYTGKGTNDGEA